MKDILWYRSKLKNCSFKEILNCINYCWYSVPAKKQRRLKKKLIKIAYRVAKIKLKSNEIN